MIRLLLLKDDRCKRINSYSLHTCNTLHTIYRLRVICSYIVTYSNYKSATYIPCLESSYVSLKIYESTRSIDA